MGYIKKKHLQANILAIHTAFELEQNGLAPSAEQRGILNHYSGFGGLKTILKTCDTIEDRNSWNPSEQELFEDIQYLHTLIKDYAPDGNHYQSYVDSLKHSVLSAFYTPMEVSDAIAGALQAVGIQAKSILDPAAGTGAFAASFQVFGAKINCFEKDLLTGKILNLLHPKATTHTAGFETIDTSYTNYFDIVSSNIPFGDYRIYDPLFAGSKDAVRQQSAKAIHNYFFLKAVDVTRQGGLIAFITSRGVMDSATNKQVRTWLMTYCKLISVIRLPDNLFVDTANTQVGSDLIILQKDSSKEVMTPFEIAFTQTRILSNDCSINNCYMDFSRVIHTQVGVGTDPYGKPAINFHYKHSMQELASTLSAMIQEDCSKRLAIDLYNSHAKKEIKQAESVQEITSAAKREEKQETEETEPILNLYDLFGIPQEERSQISTKQKTGISTDMNNQKPSELSLSEETDPFTVLHTGKNPCLYTEPVEDFYGEGTLVQYKGQTGYLSLKTEPQDDKMITVHLFNPIEVTHAQSLRIKDYIPLRDTYHQLFAEEYEHQSPDIHLRQKLNALYQEYISRHGDLNHKDNYRTLLLDKSGSEVCSLEYFENGQKKLADIFDKPVSFNHTNTTQIRTVNEALSCSLNKYGYPNLAYMCRQCHQSQDELLEELDGILFYNPLLGRYEISAHFIAGDVIAKSEAIANYLKDNPDISDKEISEKSLAVLKQAIPTAIPFSDLDFNLGERWIPEKFYNEFATQLLGTNVQINYFSDLDNFHIEASSETTIEITEKYAVAPVDSDKLNGLKLLSHALLNTFPKITKGTGRYNESGNEIRVADTEAIQQAHAKIEEIRADFTDWLTGLTIEVKEELAALYNRKFNARVIPKYDGQFQTFPDLQLTPLGIERPYTSQYDTVWMLKSNRGGIVDHEVGSGKTLTICIAAHEMKRLKMADKPLIIGKKGNIFEIAATYAKVYPNDKILYPSEKDFLPENRKRLFYKMKHTSWDVIILTHDQFFKIPQSLEVQFNILQAELDSVEENLRVAERLSGRSASNAMLKGLLKRQNNLEAALKELYGKMEKRRDEVIDFKTMGIDHIFIDESHVFKNLRFDTRYRNVAGLGDPKGSQRALNLLYAIRTIQDKFNSDLCTTFLSGTTISNSLVELYLIFKYLRPRAMEAQGIRTFDAWAAVYAKKTSDYEFTVTNEIKSKERFRFFKNVPELAKFYNEITDYRTAKDVNIIRPENNIILCPIKQTPEQAEFRQNLIDFARTGDGKYIGRPGSDYSDSRSGRMLVVTDLARKAAIDMRLIDEQEYGDHPDTKISQAAKTIADYYYKYDKQHGTQFVFSDIGTYKPDKWNIYTELKNKLVEEYHLPAYEIRFIQEAASMHQREQMIGDFRQGRIRVLIGHTESLGTGVDAPQKCVAVHNLSMPWTPKDLDQRSGRGARKGNEVARLFADNKVDNYMYAAEGSLDTYMFNLLQNKQTFITQLKTNSLGTRIIDEGAMDGEGSMNYSEFVAILSGNSDLLEKTKLERKVMALESEFKSHNKQHDVTAWKIKYINQEIEKDKNRLRNIEQDWEYINSHLPINEEGLRPNPIRLDDFQYNDNPMAVGEQLIKIGKYKDTGGHYSKIGTLLRFEILVKTEKIDNKSYNRFYIEGGCKYTYNNGYLAETPELAVTNFIRAFNKIPTLIDKYRTEIAKQQKDVSAMQDIINIPWRKEQELRQMKIQLATLERKIQATLEQIDSSENINTPVEMEEEMVGVVA